METSTTIKMPKNITTLEQFNEWCKSLNTDKQELNIWMKRRKQFYPYSFSNLMFGSRVHYLISDSFSTGVSYVKNFNRVFTFKICKLS